MKVYLIRHAKTKDADENLSQRHDTNILVDTRAKTRVQEIKKLVDHIDQAYSSPLTRTLQTSDLIFGNMNYEILDYIYEYKTPTEIIGKSREFAIDYWENKHKKDKMDIDWKPEGGESFAETARRVKKFHKFLLNLKREKGYKEVAVVGHGIFFRHLLLAVVGMPWTDYPQLIFDVLRKLSWENLGVIEIEI